MHPICKDNQSCLINYYKMFLDLIKFLFIAGIVSNGIRHEHEPALPLLSGYVTKDD